MTSSDNTSLSTSNPNSKRGSKMSSNQSLNHLLNFTLPPRQSHANLPRRSNRKSTGNSAYGVRSTERFVNAQYRFVMKPSGDYTVHFADPDIFFQWHDVLQVIIPRTSAVAVAGLHRGNNDLTTCPICLSPPTAPRMTKCGHVFCFPCILHYLNISDVEKWTRCPICFDSVNEKHLKGVKWFDDDQSCLKGEGGSLDYEPQGFYTSSRPSGTLRMRLMQRPQITTLSLPRSSTWPSELIPPHQAPFHFLPDVFTFSKFMLATPSQLVADLTKDLDELSAERRTLEGMGDDFGIPFVDAAQSKVRFQIEETEAMDSELLQRSVDKAQHELVDIEHREARIKHTSLMNLEAKRSREDKPEELLSLDAVGVHALPASGSNFRSPRSRRNLNPPPPSSSTYYYYQSAAGSPIFLHPLDIRILLSHFSSYVSFPDEINIKVDAFSEGAVNADLRKRCKYLALPEGADVIFVEADLESVVGADALKNFEGALKTRRAKRKEKGRKDDRARIRAEEKEQERVYKQSAQWDDPRGFTSPVNVPELSPSTETHSPPAGPIQHLQAAGAWGPRSFASAVHASPAAHPPPRGPIREEVLGDEWDIDVAWHEMEQRSGGRKKGRNQKMMIVGGGPGGARSR